MSCWDPLGRGSREDQRKMQRSDPRDALESAPCWAAPGFAAKGKALRLHQVLPGLEAFSSVCQLRLESPQMATLSFGDAF